MVFSSVIFLFFFLPAVYIMYCLCPGIRMKNALLIVASLFFYAFGEPVYVILMTGSILINGISRQSYLASSSPTVSWCGTMI